MSYTVNRKYLDSVEIGLKNIWIISKLVLSIACTSCLLKCVTTTFVSIAGKVFNVNWLPLIVYSPSVFTNTSNTSPAFAMFSNISILVFAGLKIKSDVYVKSLPLR